MRARGARPAVTVLAAALTVGLASGCGVARQAADPSQAATAPRARPPALHAVLERHLHIRSGVVALAAGDGALWVTGFGAVSRRDRKTGRSVATIATPGMGPASQMAAGAGSIWVTVGPAVYRIDTSTDRVTAVIRPGGTLIGVTTGAGRVWVSRPTEGRGDVIRIDPRTNRVNGPPITVGPGPGPLAYGHGEVLVENTAPASLMRIDPANGRATTLAGAGADAPLAGGIATGYGSLWMAASDSLVRVNPSTGAVLANLSIPRASDVAIGSGAVWVVAEPQSTSPSRFYPVKDTAELWEVDPSRDRTIGRPVRLAVTEPIGLAVTGREVWVGDYPDALMELRLTPDGSRRRRHRATD